MKIVKLIAENIKILKAIEITPDGATVCVGGDNAQGKSSVLDAIEYALGGEASIPEKTIRDGQEKAKIVVDLGDLEVTRTFTTKGTRLVVKNKDGSTFSSPQAVLNKLFTTLTFDPMQFLHTKPQDRVGILKRLMNIDFTSQDAEYKKLFEERTAVNREGKDLRAKIDGLTRHNVPASEVSVSELTSQYSSGMAINTELENKTRRLGSLETELASLLQKVSETKTKIEELKTAIAETRPVDITSLWQQISTAEETNKKIRENKQYDYLSQKLTAMRTKSQELTDRLEQITSDKESVLKNAEFPVSGLGFTENGVTFNGVDFEECSTAEQLKVSVGIGLAMNPNLRILLVREGSLLDKKSLGLIAEMAEKHDAQIWIERVSKSEECQVIIENGQIVS